MSDHLNELLRTVLRLPREERELLAEALNDSLTFNPLDLAEDPELVAIVTRRLREIDEGLVQSVPWSEAREVIHGRVKPRHTGRTPAGDG
jgi:putative addiction module component (TIGR02574 family)